MSYGNRWRSAKDRVSREFGHELMSSIILHDDGQFAHGGIMAWLSGPRGSGKTTFAQQLAQGVAHLPITQTDRNDCSRIYPETVVWRARKFEYFLSLLPDQLG